MMVKTTLFLLLVCVLMPFAAAQETKYFLGKVIDAESKEPIVFANVRIKDRSMGVISNVDGSFRIPAIYKEMGEILELSSMGYVTKEVDLASFAEDRVRVIFLKPAVLGLDEVVVAARWVKSANVLAHGRLSPRRWPI